MKPQRISAKLSLINPGHDGLILDLRKGFSEQVYLETVNEEEQDVVYHLPCFHVEPSSDNAADIHLGRALQLDLLEFADEDDNAVGINAEDLDLPNSKK